MRWARRFAVLFLGFALMGSGASRGTAGEVGRQFLAWQDFTSWKATQDDQAQTWSLQSPAIRAAIDFNQLVLSWNIAAESSAAYTFFVEVNRGTEWSQPYVLGRWALGASNGQRTSFNGQRDEVAQVSTDTLLISQMAQQFRVRIQVGSDRAALAQVRLIGVSLLDTSVELPIRDSDRRGWGVELAVPQLCQLDYDGGEVWCSPTSVGMVLSHWANVQSRAELKRTVPELAAEIFDPGWSGTGNWPFNTAYAGSFDGIRGFVVRLSDVTELEAFVEAGIPVVVSVAYSVLKREPPRAGDGHLVVCVGFTSTGDIILNDPARQPEVRWVYSRSAFVDAWSRSRNTAYVIYPETISPPADPNGLWSVGLH